MSGVHVPIAINSLSAPISGYAEWALTGGRSWQIGPPHVGDLLLHCPRRYEDRRQFRSIREVALGEFASLRGNIVALGLKRYAKDRNPCSKSSWTTGRLD